MSAYYYAGGRKVVLDSDEEHVAVDRRLARQAGLAAEVEEASVVGSRQEAVMVVAQRSALGHDTLASLEQAGAIQPVYRRDRAVVVPLPEVRIEVDTPEQHRAVLAALGESGVAPHRIAEETSDRIVVQPESGHGDDALTLANEIYERAHPAAASVRFVQFVPKPSSAAS